MAVNKGVKIGNILYPNQVDAANVTTTDDKQFSSAAEKAKWNNPAAADIVQDPDHQLVSAAEKESWGIQGGMPVFTRSGVIDEYCSWNAMWFGGVMIYGFQSTKSFGGTWNYPYELDKCIGVSGHVPDYYANDASTLSADEKSFSYSQGKGAKVIVVGFKALNPFVEA